MNYLIVSLFVFNLIMIKNKRFPKGRKVLAWVTIVIFSFHWGVGGLIEYPIFANIAGIAICMFWMGVVLFILVKLYDKMKIFFLNRKKVTK